MDQLIQQPDMFFFRAFVVAVYSMVMEKKQIVDMKSSELTKKEEELEDKEEELEEKEEELEEKEKTLARREKALEDALRSFDLRERTNKVLEESMDVREKHIERNEDAFKSTYLGYEREKFLKTDFTKSKIKKCVYNGHEFKKLSYSSIFMTILEKSRDEIIKSSSLVKQGKLEKKGCTYFEKMDISVRGANSTQLVKEIVKISEKNKATLELLILLADGTELTYTI
jgi:hypothetical protein